MIDRISKNEKRLDIIKEAVNELEVSLDNFKNLKKEFNSLNKYYGSSSWFKDKELYESNKIPKVKAGVLSEDAVWNLNDQIKDLVNDMKDVIRYYE